ncbi:MAG: VWA domain-containing protein [Candidatus Sulfotelmatobacter sp.]
MRSRRRFAAASGFCLGIVLSISTAGYGFSSKNNAPSHGSAAVSLASEQSQSSAPTFDLTSPEGVASYCEVLARGKDQAKALQAVCEYALSLPWKLSNMMCQQVRSSYQEGETAAAAQRNRLTATLRYEDGKEKYSDIKAEGEPVQFWSQGEFMLDLRNIFSPQISTEFKFTKQETIHANRVLIFDFKVDRKNNHLIGLAAGTVTVFPGYRGRLWINKSTLRLVKFELDVDDVAADFPMQQVTTKIDYNNITLGDGTDLVLPVLVVDVNCPTGASIHCWHDRLTFTHWHRFTPVDRTLAEESAAEVRVLTPPATAATPVPVDLFAGSMDLRRGSEMAAEILNDQFAAIDIAEKLLESQAAAAAEASIPAPKSEANKNAFPPVAEPAGRDDQVAVLKTRVRLVLVPAVVRDAKDHTVNTLQKNNFRLFDDQRPQLITQFSLETAEGTGTGTETGGVGTAKSPAALAQASRFEAYVFDDIHASQGDLLAARNAAKRHLAELPTGDHAGIFALSGTVVLDFTSDLARLNDALERLRSHPSTAAGPFRCPNISYVQADLITNKRDAIALAAATADALKCAYANASDAATRVAAERLAESTAAEVFSASRAESLTSFKVINAILSAMSQMRGQRVIVLVSPGFAIAEMEEAETKVIDDAVRSGIVINVLDPSGVSTSSGIEYGSASGTSDVLGDLSSGSGGVFFRNKNDLDAGFQKTSLPESFYVLGFSPAKLDGKFHKLKVTLQVPEKLTVQARRGYYAPKPEN